MVANTRNQNVTADRPQGLSGGRDESPTLISRLANLGLGDDQLVELLSLLSPMREAAEPLREAAESRDAYEGDNGHVVARPQERRGAAATDVVTLYVAEEQEILRNAYMSLLGSESGIEIVGSSDYISEDSVIEAVKALEPRAILIGVKNVEASTAQVLAALSEECPETAIVLLFATYDGDGIKALREVSGQGSAGCAYLLKHTIDTADQLTQVILSVVQGRIMLDPIVMEGLIRSDSGGVLGELTPKELEVLGWMAKGYRNDTIAQLLSRDVKTVERHINNIYSKLHNNRVEDRDNSKHPRVRAALAYLNAIGLLPDGDLIDE